MSKESSICRIFRRIAWTQFNAFTDVQGTCKKYWIGPQFAETVGESGIFKKIAAGEKGELSSNQPAGTTFVLVLPQKVMTMTSIRDDGTVEFKFFRPVANDVKLAGDFCGWAGHAVVMQPLGNGWWFALLNLEPGEYRFRYIADGSWFTDFASNGIEVCKEGWNSVLFVSETKKQNKTPAKSAAA